MIEVRDLIFEYPTKRALHGVSLDVEPGSITALVGPNGAGKTTLLRCIAGLETPYAGHVRIDGLRVSDDPRRIHKQLGFLPDFFGLYDQLTVRQCLTFAARSHGLTEGAAADAQEKTAARVGLADRTEALAGELSRGLRQRLAVGQAIVHEPPVLLLDEPASGLDPQARRDLSSLLLDLQSQGMTLVVSSHILAELEDYSTAMIIMDDGRIARGGAIRVEDDVVIRVEIELSQPNKGLPDFLEAREEVTVRQASDEGALIETEDDPAIRHSLLTDLMSAGFTVSGFAPRKRKLEDTYFDEMES
jgi:ABC-2 type transport system ATP-binding protein